MHGLRAVRERLPRGRDCDGGRKGEARQGRLLRKLVKDDYCDGMGDCLPECPAGAIKIVEREAAAYDEKAVQERKMAKMQEQMKAGGMALHPEGHTPPPGGLDRRSLGGGGCPGKAMRTFNRAEENGRAVAPRPPLRRAEGCPPYQDGYGSVPSQLAQWPCQIRLVPVKAPFSTARSCSSRRTARPTHTRTSIRSSCAAR